MIVDNTVRYRLAHVVRTTVRAGEMLPRHWVDIIRYVTGDVTPVLQMREGVAYRQSHAKCNPPQNVGGGCITPRDPGHGRNMPPIPDDLMVREFPGGAR